MQVAVGPVVIGHAPPMADANHAPTLLDGSLRRFCRDKLPVDLALLAEFKEFVASWLDTNVNPLDSESVVSPVRWISENENYPGTRKRQLLDTYANFAGTYTDARHDNELHCKRETYGQYKPARGINSRHDEFKILYGPLVSALEAELYRLPYFIKHVPVLDRPAYISQMFCGHSGKKYVTDYSAFESHFDVDLMEACEFQLYRHGWKNFPEAAVVYCNRLGSVNRCKNKKFTVTVKAKRMSGEMSTSLGNGFTNLMVALFAAHKAGGSLTGVVEGDDGLFGCSCDLDETTFARLGFRIKIEVVHNIFEASFCGLMMSSDLTSFADPRKVILNFGWSHSPLSFGGFKLRCELLRAKALSLLCEHPQCPILGKLALQFVEATDGHKARFGTSWYERQNLGLVVLHRVDECRLKAAEGPSAKARLDFEALFNIPVSLQLQLEEEISRMDIFSNFDSGHFADLFEPHSDSADYWDRYVFEAGSYPRLGWV